MILNRFYRFIINSELINGLVKRWFIEYNKFFEVKGSPIYMLRLMLWQRRNLNSCTSHKQQASNLSSKK